MFTVFVFLAVRLLGVTSSTVPLNSDVYTDPRCQGNIKNLWLDIMVVVDKSQLMTNAQLWQVRNTISQVFGAVSTFGPTKYPADPRSTCVGLVTYDGNATVNAQYDTSKSFNDFYNVIQGSLVSVDSTNSSYLSRGTGTSLDPVPTANRLKNNGVIVITVACTSDKNAISKIQSLASPGYSFVDEMNTSQLVKQLTNALLSANCFCPQESVQYKDDYFNETSTKYGICVTGYTATGGSYGYPHAMEWCDYEIKNSYLVSEFSQNKHEFVKNYMLDKFKYMKPTAYYIGLHYVDNQWFNPNGYSNWAPGYPQSNSTGQVIASQAWTNGSLNYVWAPPQVFDFLLVCQVQSSSTEYYTTYSEQESPF
ncbi:hypothetical protein CAEBREN_06845 [Caenorhabditis brenneri]|uniref:VWFA domain-containing protein n=1 Tax=Caenorhabditis brenneri TaxID=135651 RepID=G0NT98_CAEBE|nr:hypothetical protein CAEBREN_06845 [Caenorhabditis brenneri]